jgi:2,3-bisphosphoglycerate-independent phosphoglycerate mutase
MSADQVTTKLIEAITSQKFDFIVVNFANPDMVGHSGKLDAAKQACQIIDQQIGQLKNAILQNNATMLITADHGNIEQMHDSINNQPHTAHTTNPVPLILINNNTQNIKLQNGRLSDIAPTILDILKISQPQEMTGTNLIIKK